MSDIYTSWDFRHLLYSIRMFRIQTCLKSELFLFRFQTLCKQITYLSCKFRMLYFTRVKKICLNKYDSFASISFFHVLLSSFSLTLSMVGASLLFVSSFLACYILGILSHLKDYSKLILCCVIKS